jgi:hypothetical protein
MASRVMELVQAASPTVAPTMRARAYRRAWMAAARARQKEPVAAHPQKSNRAIAAETGVAFKTVPRALASGVPNDTPEKTIGLDGKS